MSGAIVFLWVVLGAGTGLLTGLFFEEKRQYTLAASVVIGLITALLAPLTIASWAVIGLWQVLKVLRTGVRDLRATWFPTKPTLPKARVVK